jgi:hypothetical protein
MRAGPRHRSGPFHDSRMREPPSAPPRASWGEIEEHLRTTDQGGRLNELAVFRSLAERGDEQLAAQAMDRLVRLAQGHGYDAELAPYVEAARRWCEAAGAMRR